MKITFKRSRWGLFVSGMYASGIASGVLVLTQDVALSWKVFCAVAPVSFIVGFLLYTPSAGNDS